MCLGADGLTRVYMSYHTHSTHWKQCREVNNGCLETVFSSNLIISVTACNYFFQLKVKATAELIIMTETFEADTDTVTICKISRAEKKLSETYFFNDRRRK